ncbi:MAG: methyltransferase domain-containing protein [Thiothrix sp.]|nr:methyltransferase domain-containing protein [Thiothrix sp.]HPE60754.1 methyltransferase domain-containing protein [Thiolinea sp.]
MLPEAEKMALQATPAYPVTDWDAYAELFAAVTTSVQLAVYREAAGHLTGAVVDCGCGSAKMAPFLATRPPVRSYTGIDGSQAMVTVARRLLARLGNTAFQVQQDWIEKVSGNGVYDSAVSIQSYYSWPEPLTVLQAIQRLLVPKGLFVLATVNLHLPLEALIREAEQELAGHPALDAYREHNRRLAANPGANFITMDALIAQVRMAGFRVQEAHQRHFRGGLNFLLLQKGG